MKIKIEKLNYQFKSPINVRGNLIPSSIVGFIPNFNYTFNSISGLHELAIDDKCDILQNIFLQIENLNELSNYIKDQQLHPEIDFILQSILINAAKKNKIEARLNYLMTDFNSNYFDVLKIKLTNDLLNDAVFCANIRGFFNSPAISKIRFDGNQKLDETLLNNFLNSLSHPQIFKIDYIEEPFVDILHSTNYLNKKGIRLGVDESFSIDKLNNFTNCTFVIRPSLLGYSNSLKVINHCQAQSNAVTISSCYEQISDLYTLLDLINKHDCLASNYHGLDTFKFLNTQSTEIKIIGNKILFEPMLN